MDQVPVVNSGALLASEASHPSRTMRMIFLLYTLSQSMVVLCI